MPAVIDRAKRLDDIARATLEIARERGPRGVTVRAVAATLGGSTTLVTKYLPTRPLLLGNAFRYVRENWSESSAEALGESTGKERIHALARWSLQTVDDDATIRQLWIEALASGDRAVEGLDLPQLQAHSEHEDIRAIVEQGLGEGWDWLVDTLFLVFRGYYLSSIEDPQRWRTQRAAEAVARLLNEFLP